MDATAGLIARPFTAVPACRQPGVAERSGDGADPTIGADRFFAFEDRTTDV